MRKLVQWQVERSRKVTDKAVEKVLFSGREIPPKAGTRQEALLPKAGTRAEVLRWSGNPGFVATFNSHEFVMAIIITVIVTIISVILAGDSRSGGLESPFSSYYVPQPVYIPPEVIALLAAFITSMSLLFVGWVRQVIRYIKTLGMYYAVTDTRLVIIKRGKITAEMPLSEISSTSVSRRFWGNGTIVFNQGEDYLKSHMIEAPTDKVFVFFNVLDLENLLNAMT